MTIAIEPRVSVIVPVFNGAATLVDAIESIRAQDVPVEIIVIDDGSTDDTHQVLEAMDDVVAIRQDNRGPAAARNNGIVFARAPFIAFLDDDDVWTPQSLERHLRCFDEHPNASIVLGHTAFESLDAAGHWLPVAEPRMLYHLGASLCRRDTFDRVGMLDPELRSSEDVDWFLRVRDAGLEIVVTPEVAQIHRRNGWNMTRGKDLRDLGFIEAVKRSLDRRRAAGGALP
jgi:glycosyltransferase involved in cell wall biosynthesis